MRAMMASGIVPTATAGRDQMTQGVNQQLAIQRKHGVQRMNARKKSQNAQRFFAVSAYQPAATR